MKILLKKFQKTLTAIKSKIWNMILQLLLEKNKQLYKIIQKNKIEVIFNQIQWNQFYMIIINKKIFIQELIKLNLQVCLFIIQIQINLSDPLLVSLLEIICLLKLNNCKTLNKNNNFLLNKIKNRVLLY